MKEQYLVKAQCKFDEGTDNWFNVVYLLSNCEKRYASSLEEAKMWLDKAIQRGIDNQKHGHTNVVNGIGISTEPSNGLIIVKSQIKKRQVTEWEEVE